ncbi:hypothetical protein [Pseudoalteromonas sp. OOF1S-7]|uniref:hypothetical protein n=1 Tax=Pseudoalteromonas sp. OOF1S-7 TaxID=2917757 RepID=UPI001EF42DD4|nr:hypothetical protein [Pseudoalteromonas sp. OOF1S-7]MCG7536654.1 hypothetical protein [Pseudoalteromonas sp. OOF1S-7]
MGLSNQAHSELRRLGERVKKVLTAIMRAMPAQAQTIGGFARHIGCHRSTSQRLFNAYKAKSGEQVLYYLPGQQAMHALGEQLAGHIPQDLITQWCQVSQRFATTMPQYARSHAQLKRLLECPEEDKVKVQDVNLSGQDKRAQLYYAAKSLLGMSMDEIFCAYVLTRERGREGFLQEVAMISKSQIKRETGAAPFVQFYTHPHSDDFTAPLNINANSRVDAKRFSIGIVEELSSPGLYDAFASYSPGNSGLVFDPVAGHEHFDATFIFNNPDELVDPLSHTSQCSSTSISIKNPAKKLRLLVLIEQQLDRHSCVNVGCYHGNQKVEEGKLSVEDMWTERLPEFPELRLIDLKAGVQALQWDKVQQQKLDYLFCYADLDPANYRCYLMEVDYPIWSSTYRIYFEHQ